MTNITEHMGVLTEEKSACATALNQSMSERGNVVGYIKGLRDQSELNQEIRAKTAPVLQSLKEASEVVKLVPHAALWLKWQRRRALCLSFQDAPCTDESALVTCFRMQLLQEGEARRPRQKANRNKQKQTEWVNIASSQYGAMLSTPHMLRTSCYRGAPVLCGSGVTRFIYTERCGSWSAVRSEQDEGKRLRLVVSDMEWTELAQCSHHSGRSGFVKWRNQHVRRQWKERLSRHMFTTSCSLRPASSS